MPYNLEQKSQKDKKMCVLPLPERTKWTETGLESTNQIVNDAQSQFATTKNYKDLCNLSERERRQNLPKDIVAEELERLHGFLFDNSERDKQ